jgi:hypothetical protein
MADPLTELLEWHRDEISAAAMFDDLALGTDDADCALKWRTLARLERHVAAQLETALAQRGVAVPTLAAVVDEQPRTGEGNPYLRLTWRGAMERLRPELAGYVRDFDDAGARMPADLKPLARFVTAHEQALLDFVVSELDHAGHGALDPVLRMLGQSPQHATPPVT